jgi:hypothetical protein
MENEFLEYGFGLWPWPLKASHFGRPSQEAMGVHGQRVWTLVFAFGAFRLCPAEGFNSYILLVIFNPIIWTLNKVWPFYPTAS